MVLGMDKLELSVSKYSTWVLQYFRKIEIFSHALIYIASEIKPCGYIVLYLN